jgi:hypothetical protein
MTVVLDNPIYSVFATDFNTEKQALSAGLLPIGVAGL